ncbi:MAG: hypothetical protein QOG10_6785 [Kribbellaceae bacterium]|nr:hypothetical protein [Kribbellaceae bacterium]
MVTTSKASKPSWDGINARSVNQPPARLPTVAPTPYSSRIATESAAKPVTSVSSGAK